MASFSAPLRELLQTEVNYVRELDLLVETFVKPLSVLCREEGTDIFSNVESLRGIHSALLAEMLAPASIGVWDLLKAADMPTVVRVADAFERFAPFLKLYTTYCSDFAMSQRRLESIQTAPSGPSQLASSIEAKELATGQSLRSLLIKPVQRLCKYPLLLQSLLKELPAADPAHPLLSRAASAVEGVAHSVNEVGAPPSATQHMPPRPSHNAWLLAHGRRTHFRPHWPSAHRVRGCPRPRTVHSVRRLLTASSMF